MELAPIVLFVYNRPIQTAKTLTALKENILADKSTLYIYCDGPKENATSDEIERIQSVLQIVKETKGFANVVINESPQNKGLANSIVDGVTEVINKHGKIIVLEDDILTSKYFLQFMNDCLNTYQNTDKVFSVGACNFFAEGDKYPSSFFVPVPDCWGWATWANRWADFENDSEKLLAQLRANNLQDPFNLFDFFKFEDMLEDQINGRINSWAIRWQAVSYLQNKLTIYPNPSLTQHMHSNNGTHVTGVDVDPQLATEKINIEHKVPKLYVGVFKAMLKGYFLLFSPNRYTILRRKISFFRNLILKKEPIKSYINNHNLN